MQEYPLDQNTEERQTIKKTAFNIPAIIDMLRSRLEFVSVKLLRLYNNVVPSENQRLFVLTIIIGAVCGFAAVAFHLTIKLIEGYLINRSLAEPSPSSALWIILTPALGGLVCGFLLYI